MQLKYSGLPWLPFLVYAAILKICSGCDKKETGCTRTSAMTTRWTFSKSVMACMGLSKLGPMELMFIDATVKINGAYYREVLLTLKLLPVMCEICGEFFIFQQGNVPAHPACETINRLKRDICVHFTHLSPLCHPQHRSEPSSL